MITVKINPPSEDNTTYDICGLTRQDMLGIYALLGGTTGTAGIDVYRKIEVALGGYIKAAKEAKGKFPGLKGTGKF